MIPYSTDAPLYHLPIGTVVLIMTNVVCFVIHGQPTSDAWILEFGTILNPLEWLSSMFAHANLGHLIGNMYFLAVFGLIVEGKLGFRRFVLLYLSIGLVDSALTQLIMLPSDSVGALGASSAIMGLMAICLVWAPRNELSVFLILPMPFYFFRVFFFQISILVYGVIYAVWELISLMFSNFEMSTPALHLIGIVVGSGAGALYVKKGWVDCENWDLFAVMAGTYGRFGDEGTTVGSHADASLLFGKDVDVTALPVPGNPHSGQKSGARLTHINELIDRGRFFEASAELFSLKMGDVPDQLTESRLRRLAAGLHDGNAVDEAEMFLDEYQERFDENADWCRLRLAQILLHERRKPAAALERLKLVRLSRLTSEQQQRAKSVVASAKKQIRSGVEDAADELDWDSD